MSGLINTRKRNHWLFRNSTGLRERVIVADTPEEAKKRFKEICIKENAKWKYYNYTLFYNYLQQDFLNKERANV